VPDELLAGRLTRRGFVVASAGAVTALAVPKLARATGATTAAPRTVSSFHSRPDLEPPLLAVGVSESAVAPGYVFVAPFLGTGPGTALIADNRGQPVWVYESANLVMNFRVQKFAGRPVLTWWEGTVVNGYFQGECVIADTAYRTLKRLTAGNGFHPEVHEFLISSRDTALISINNFVSTDLAPYGGPSDGTVVEGVVQEIDIATGDVLFEWHSLDHVGLDETLLPVSATWDYFHLNSIDVDQDDDLLISARYPSAVYKLDRSTGALIWRLGGTKSDFRLGAGATFWFQHDARGHPGGLLSLFDDGADSPTDAPEATSRAIVLGLDTAAMTAELVRSLPNPHASLTFAMGDAQVLADGGCFVGWGTTPEFTEFGPDGSVRLDASFPGGQSSYRAFRAEWTGLPADRPAAAAVRNANGSADIYASWNGATEIASWQVHGGDTPTRLAILKTAPRTGFETRIRLAHGVAHVLVAALDRRGKVLGSSARIVA
jgi:Arylsulfotransferase (ASST)